MRQAASKPAAIDRRELMKLIGLCAALPLSAGAAAAPAKQQAHPQASIYDRLLGVRTIINAAGPVTALGGTLLSKEVSAAMAQMRESERPIAVIVAKGPTNYFVADVNGPALFVGALNDGEEAVVAKRAREILTAAQRAA